ncbi:response regulator [Pelagicoccus sp. SDUM812003]|uniref:response regulator n=1 Tax=Pelagicoccus sp. SDUM812003 TaxID=3041267 RepID=UPI00280FE614|nr:response regulator [Pelagicoccus sp. SDUM812003]MDQ8201633.1 response regulator [Pelagicoccus sp. SDUM812003]
MSAATNDIDLASLQNRSILLIDDNHAIHRDYKAVLCPEQYDSAGQKLDELEDMLFDDQPKKQRRRIRNFVLQSAFQGEEAFEMVKKHLAKGVRYPLAYVDMRMPPGWDGLETIENLRQVDPQMNFIIVTAYSDHTYDTIVDRLGPSTPARILYKPFDPSEIYEMSYKILREWNDRNHGG